MCFPHSPVLGSWEGLALSVEPLKLDLNPHSKRLNPRARKAHEFANLECLLTLINGKRKVPAQGPQRVTTC